MRNNYTVLSSYCTPGFIPKNNYGNLNSYLAEGFQIVVNPSMDETTVTTPLTTTNQPVTTTRMPILTKRPITTTPVLTIKPVETPPSRPTIPPLFSPIGVL